MSHSQVPAEGSLLSSPVSACVCLDGDVPALPQSCREQNCVPGAGHRLTPGTDSPCAAAVDSEWRHTLSQRRGREEERSLPCAVLRNGHADVTGNLNRERPHVTGGGCGSVTGLRPVDGSLPSSLWSSRSVPALACRRDGEHGWTWHALSPSRSAG